MIEKNKFGKGIVYLNGEFINNEQAKISIFDSACIHGDSVQDHTRTFNGKLFKLPEHIRRLFMSLKAARIKIPITPEEMEKITLKVLDENKKFIKIYDDGWIVHFISSGLIPINKFGIINPEPTIAIYFKPIDFERYAKFYDKGLHAITAITRRVSPNSMDPKMKQCSRMDLNVATREIKCIDSEAWSLLLDQFGNISEGDGYNIFLVSNGIIKTPSASNCLRGISRETVLELAEKLKIPAMETRLQSYDLYNADEAFFSGTSHCVIPITKFNMVEIGNGKVGPIYKKLLEAWSEMVGVDIVKQAKKHIKK